MVIQAQQVAVVELAEQGGPVEQRRIGDGHQAVEGPVQGIAGGAIAIGVIGDHPGVGIAGRQGAQAGSQPARARGAEQGRDAGERHLVAVVQIAADADPGHVLGEAQAEDVDVVAIGHGVAGGRDRIAQVEDRVGGGTTDTEATGIEHRLGQDVGGAAVEGPQGRIQRLGGPLGHDAPVAVLARLDVGATANVAEGAARSGQARPAGVAQQEGLGTEAHQIRAAVIGAGFRQAGGVPVQEVLGGEGPLRVQGEGGGDLVAGHEQLFRFRPRGCRKFGEIQAGLAIAEGVHRAQQGFPPEDVVLAYLDPEQGFVTHLHVVEHEGIEQLAGGAMVVAIRIVAQMTVARHRGQPDDAGAGAVAVDEGVLVSADVAVGIVIPAGGADAKAGVALVHHVQLGQQIEAGGDGIAGILEVVIPIVVVRGGEHPLVGTLGAHAVVELAGVVEANGPLFASGIDFDRLNGGHEDGRNGRRQQAEAQDAATMTRVHVIHYSLSECRHLI
ncbi:hypothetical protein D3C75_612460 [compost metagenome]